MSTKPYVHTLLPFDKFFFVTPDLHRKLLEDCLLVVFHVIFNNDGCVELSWKWGVPKQYLKWEVVPEQPVKAEKPSLITFFFIQGVYSQMLNSGTCTTLT